MSTTGAATAGCAPRAGVGLRWARALALAATAWGSSSAAHLIGGGRPPAAPVVLALVALTAWPLALGLHRRAGRRMIVALLSAAQAVMHAAFTLIAWVGAQPVLAPVVAPAAPVDDAEHLHSMDGMAGAMPIPVHLPTTVPGGTGAAPMAGHTMSILPSPGMLLAHVSAAVLLGCLLAVGERALFSLLGLLAELARPAVRAYRHLLRALTALAAGIDPPATAGSAPPPDDTGPRPADQVLVGAVLRRGPPSSLPVLALAA